MTGLSWLTADLDELPADQGWLSAAERAFARGLEVPKRRQDWLLGRYVAKRAVAIASGDATGSLAHWEILPASDGAPRVAVDGGVSPVNGEADQPPAISISHSRGRALCVLTAAGTAPGGDLERIEPRDDAFVDTFFTARERALVVRAPAHRRDLLTTLIWSAKESALKSLRVGLRADTRSVEVDVNLGDATGDWRRSEVTCDRTGQRLPGWWRTDDGFVVTVAADRPTGVPVRLAA